jgi:predicted nucleotidyltransferase
VVVATRRTTVVEGAPSLRLLQAKRQEIVQLAARHGAPRLRVYGSVARGTGPDSDIDLLVDLEPGRSLIDEIELQQDLEALLGHPVNVAEDVHRAIRARALAEAVPL